MNASSASGLWPIRISCVIRSSVSPRGRRRASREEPREASPLPRRVEAKANTQRGCCPRRGRRRPRRVSRARASTVSSNRSGLAGCARSRCRSRARGAMRREIARQARDGKRVVRPRRARAARDFCPRAMASRPGARGDLAPTGAPLRAVIHLSTAIHRRRSGASGAAPRKDRRAKPRQITAAKDETSDPSMNARAQASRRRASA
jgi:hypothetical protein